MLKAIVFDFDGVILESIGVKKEAFRKLFEDSQYVDQIVQYHMDNGGLSRYRKFDYIYEHYIKKPLTVDRSAQLGRLFREYAIQGVLEANFVTGANHFLEKYHARYELFVASGTPHEEMLEVVQARGLEKYFREVFGSPPGKGEILSTIMNCSGITANEMIFVGDAMTDYQGAMEAGVSFIGRISDEYGNPFEGLPVKALIKDLLELDQIIEKDYSNVG